jgi:hypothetical protein
VIVPAPAASVDCNVYDGCADPNLKQACCRVGCHTNVIRRGAVIDNERQVLRIDARNVDAPYSPVDGGGKLFARTMDSDLPHAAVDFNFVLHEY